MPSFRKFSDLQNYIEEKIKDSLGNEVIEIVKDVELDNIEKEVYNKYEEPIMYKRRRENEGLLDRDNIKAYPRKNYMQYEIINETRKKGRRNEYLAPLIEYGHQKARALYNDIGYEFPRFGLAYMRPRRFTEATIRELRQYGEHVDTMKDGLKARGLDVR
jgi:hypothetical protein